MGKKNISRILRFGIYGVLGLAFLAGGIFYARFEKGGIENTLPNKLSSQFINNLGGDKTKTPTSTISPDKIQARIDQLETEIVQETNDPDRALTLRREVQNLRNQLQPKE